VRSTRQQRQHDWPAPPGWAIFPDGLTQPARLRWERDAASPSPRLDGPGGSASGPRRLVEALAAAPVTEKDRRYVKIVVGVLLVVTVFGQRFALPLGPTPIALPLVAAYLAVFMLRFRGGIRYNRVRTELFIMASAAVVIATYLSGRSDNGASINSLLLLLVIYLPWVFCVASAYSDLVLDILRLFVRIMIVAALIGVAQMVTQFTGLWAYEDYLETFVPPDFLMPGYNTSFHMQYNSPINKANAFFFLEPSFLCQYCSLALIIGVLIRARAWQLLILALGMASTLSGTGILLLVVGTALVVFRSPRQIRPAYIAAGIIGLIIIFQTPAADFLLSRSDETTQSGSSGNQRFVLPYTEVFSGLQEDPIRYLVGAGPGTSDRLLESSANDQIGEAVVYTIAPKLAFEYGLVAATIFIAFMLVAILRGPPMRALPGTVIFMLFFLSGSLLQPHTVVTAWLLTSIWGQPVTLGVTDALAAARRQRAAGALPAGATSDPV
jgi:hypothetical protein